jgi:hypothetical protein
VPWEPAGTSPLSADQLRDLLPEKFLEWVKTTLDDQRYKDVLNVRNPLTHSHVNRHLSGSTAPPTQTDRTKFPVIGRAQPMNARDLVVMSAELALDRVRAFIEVVDQHGR